MIDLEKLRQVMRELAAEKGDFTLFGLFLREEAPDKWDLVISSPWIEEGKLTALGEFVEKLTSTIGEDEVREVSRIITVNYGDPNLDAILRAVSLDDGLMEVMESLFFGLPIKHAYILRSKRPPQRSKRGT